MTNDERIRISQVYNNIYWDKPRPTDRAKWWSWQPRKVYAHSGKGHRTVTKKQDWF